MQSSKAPAKGILKSLKPSASGTPQVDSKDDVNRGKALFRARLIQQQKDMELKILASIEALLEIPQDSKADPTRPSDSDTAFFKESLRLFRASDFDDLIEERNIDKKCGYALCPRPCREEDMSSKYRVLRGKRGPDIVETRTMQKWCSASCARHAMYVKVQLSEEPAWLRPASTRWHLELLNEVHPEGCRNQDPPEALEEQVLKLKLDQESDSQGTSADLKALALERGKASEVDGKPFVDIAIREKDIITSTAKAPELRSGQSDSIEGYTPKGLEKMNLDDEDDMLETL